MNQYYITCIAIERQDAFLQISNLYHMRGCTGSSFFLSSSRFSVFCDSTQNTFVNNGLARCNLLIFVIMAFCKKNLTTLSHLLAKTTPFNDILGSAM